MSLLMRSPLPFYICTLACPVVVSQAKEKCGAEIKLLLQPTELHSALKSFNAQRETIGSEEKAKCQNVM